MSDFELILTPDTLHSDGRESLMWRPNFLRDTHEFTGPDGISQYRWKGKKLGTDLTVSPLLRVSFETSLAQN